MGLRKLGMGMGMGLLNGQLAGQQAGYGALTALSRLRPQ